MMESRRPHVRGCRGAPMRSMVAPQRMARLLSALVAFFNLGTCCLALLPHEDWLVGRQPTPAALTVDPTDGSLLLSNGLISRRFVTSPNFATVSLTQEAPFSGHSGAIEMLRGVGPEARIQFKCPSGTRRQLLPYAHNALEGNTTTEHGGKDNWANSTDGGVEVGGLHGQGRYMMFNPSRWNLTSGPGDFLYTNHTVGMPEKPWEWPSAGQRNSPPADWPPAGISVRVNFKPDPTDCSCYCDATVTVVYELYDKVPTMTKWVEVSNGGSKSFTVERLVTEELHATEHAKSNLHPETDFMPRKTAWEFAQMPASDPGGGQYDGKKMNYPTWWIDPDYEDDLHDQSLHADVAHTALLMQLQYPLGPMQPVAAGDTERFFKVFLMIWDSDDAERRSLHRRRSIRTLFPQIAEAPLYFYSTNASSAGIRKLADQCNSTGFEAIILSFGR